MGRESQLGEFERALADPLNRGFVIYGPAGVGKSRLAEECLRRAVQAGFRSGQATASTAAATVPLGAIAHLVADGLAALEPVASFSAVQRELSGAEQHRWVMLIDDLHLLDATSAMLLRQLMDANTIRLIGTVRAGEPISDAISTLQHGDATHRVHLSELSEAQVGELLRSALGGPVGLRTVRELFTASGGNVLYLRELVLGAFNMGTLKDDGEVWQLAANSIPGTPRLAALVEARLAMASLAGRPLLELLALCEPLPLGDLEAIASFEVQSDLEEAGLIQVTRHQRRSTVSLAHPLYGEVLRAGLPSLRRRKMLLEQVARVDAHGARRRDDPLHIASWRLAATGTADPAQLVRAAALARHAHDYKQVIALLEALGEEHHSTMTRVLLAEALWEIGQPQRAEALLLTAEEHASGEQEKLTVAVTRVMNLFWGSSLTDQALMVNEAAHAEVRSAAGRRVLAINEGWIRTVSGEPVQGLALLEGLEADAHRTPDINAWLWGAIMKTTGLALVGRSTEAVSWAEHAHAAHVRLNEEALVPHPSTQLLVMAIALAENGQLAEARAVGERAFVDLVTARAPMPRLWTAFHLARAEWLAGHPSAARHWYAEAAALARDLHHVRALQIVLTGLAASAALLGDLGAAEIAQAEADSYPSMGFLSGEERLGEAWMHAVQGRLAQARSVLLDAATAARQSGHTTSEALLLTDVARLEGARDVAARLAELATECDGALAPARAHLAEALAAKEPVRLLACAEELERIGADLLAAEAAAAASTAWRRLGEARYAAAATHRAAVLTVRCEGARTPALMSSESIALLTPREREIALLAVRGNSSKRIAAELTLSVRTVDNHLNRIYCKLGVRGRQALTHALTQHAQIR
ncbi:LuxR C-terminal-related transcriptional regulator [Streptomyces virginiae]|uniref:LuxR C-terminal-related transcriptional regulator n=1 Tax=Streptomyces virginiae TaxID=1961 RepID=UPI0036CE96B4